MAIYCILPIEKRFDYNRIFAQQKQTIIDFRDFLSFFTKKPLKSTIILVLLHKNQILIETFSLGFLQAKLFSYRVQSRSPSPSIRLFSLQPHLLIITAYRIKNQEHSPNFIIKLLSLRFYVLKSNIERSVCTETRIGRGSSVDAARPHVVTPI